MGEIYKVLLCERGNHKSLNINLRKRHLVSKRQSILVISSQISERANQEPMFKAAEKLMSVTLN